MATIAIVPGSFSPAHCYTTLTDRLTQHGVQSVVIDLPSVGRRDGKPPGTMTDDVNEISRVVSALADDGKEVILMTHSYGGIPGTQSLENLSHKARSSEGKPGGIKQVVYLTSVLVQVGVSNFDLFGDNFPDSVTIKDDYMTLDPAGNAPLTFSDMPFEEGLRHVNDMADHSTPSFMEKLSYAGYNDVEVHYIVCEDDKVIPPEYQYGMIEMVKASSGREPKVHKLQSGHAPNISQPDNLVTILKDIVNGL